MIDRESVQGWLDRYVEAWKSYDRSEIEALFTDDAEYWYHPYDAEAVIGAAAIAESWLASPDPAGTWEADYGPHLIEGHRATATGTTKYDNGRTFWNIWALDFAADGRCERFVEWYMET